MNFFKKLFGPADPEGFAKLLIKEIRRNGYAGEIHFDPGDFKLTFVDGVADDHVLYLNNAYREYVQASRSVRKAIIQKYANLTSPGQVEVPAGFDEAKANVLPRIQSRFYHETIRLTLRMDNPDGNFETTALPFNEYLALDLVYDRPESIQTVTPSQLADWKTTRDQAMAIAKDNLWARSNEAWNELAPGLHLSPWQDSHDASRLFLHDLIWQLPVKGDHVALVPNRVMLLVTGADDEPGLCGLGAIVEEAMEKDRAICGMPMRLQGTRWVPWLPPEGHPAHWPLRKAGIRTRAIEYDEQQSLLERHFEKTQQDIFVAKFTVMGRKDDTWFSWAIWIDGITDALLPEAEYICLARVDDTGQDTEPLGWARFEDVRQVAGDLLEPTEHQPPRYRIRSFPTEAQIQAMRLKPEPGE